MKKIFTYGAVMLGGSFLTLTLMSAVASGTTSSDTSWISSGETVSAAKLKANLDELFGRTTSVDASKLNGLSASDIISASGGSLSATSGANLTHYTAIGTDSCASGYTKAWDGHIYNTGNNNDNEHMGYVPGSVTNSYYCIDDSSSTAVTGNHILRGNANEHHYFLPVYAWHSSPHEFFKCAVCLK